MSQRTDTLLRYALLAVGGVALIVMYAVAGNESSSRSIRFVVLVALGGMVLVGWPGTALTQTYLERRPLRVHWGKPGHPEAAPTGTSQAPNPIHPEVLPVTIALDKRRDLIALGSAVVATAVLGILAYAISGSANPEEGGFLLFVAVAGAILLALRAVFRVITGAHAVVADDQGVTLGPALGFVPQLTIARPAVAALEIKGGPDPMLTIVTRAGRRFEIRIDHLREPALPNYLAALWPEVGWRAP